MAGKKFPQQIHVVRENEGDPKEEYLSIREDGIDDELFTETKSVAVYNLAEVGEVVVERKYRKAGK